MGSGRAGSWQSMAVWLCCRCALPRRRDLPNEHGLLLVSSAVHRQRDLFFIIVQSEFGDLYKVTLTHQEDQERPL